MFPPKMGRAGSPFPILVFAFAVIVFVGCSAPTVEGPSNDGMSPLLQEISYKDQPESKPAGKIASQLQESKRSDRGRQLVESVWTGIRVAGDMVLRTASWTVGAMLDGIFDDDDDDDRQKSSADRNLDRWLEAREKWRDDSDR